MKFNVSKCKVMNVTLKQKKIVSPLYHLSGEHLEEVRKYKYLGVIIMHNLTWSEHCSAKVKTANKIMGLVRRTLRNCNYTCTRPRVWLIQHLLGPTWNTVPQYGAHIRRKTSICYKGCKNVLPIYAWVIGKTLTSISEEYSNGKLLSCVELTSVFFVCSQGY